MSVITKKLGQLEYLTAEGFSVPHCFTTRLGGVSTGIFESLDLAYREGVDTPLLSLGKGYTLGRPINRTIPLLVVYSPSNIKQNIFVAIRNGRKFFPGNTCFA